MFGMSATDKSIMTKLTLINKQIHNKNERWAGYVFQNKMHFTI